MPAIADWGGFFTAQLGAAATIGGLVFVGLSLNLTKILQFPSLPNRALLAVSVLLGILLVSSFVLMPGQSPLVLGVEIAATGAAFSLWSTSLEIHTFRHDRVQSPTGFIGNMLLLEASFIPYVIGGIYLINSNTAGLYWVAGGAMMSFVKAIGDSWVLVVEINR